MSRELFVAGLIALICTVFWLGLAFFVAYPKEMANWHLAEMRGAFFGPEPGHRIYIPLLVAADILIDWVLGHRRLAGWSGFICLAMAVFYVVVVGLVPALQESPSNSSVTTLFTFAILFLAIARWLSFLYIRETRRVDNSIPS
jgi:uncharacterized membrane protein (DUF485 family)